MAIVLAAPLVLPDIPPPFTVPMTWTGFDGSVWSLNEKDSFPAMRPGVKGLHVPPVNVFQSSTPLVPGVDLTGYALPERPVYWPLSFAAKDVAEWFRTYSAFFDSFHPVKPGVWTVGEGDTARSLPLTGVFVGDYTFTADPFTTGFGVIGVELQASRPLWRGLPVTRDFFAEEEVDFIPSAPGVNYYPSISSVGQATIDNPGDEPVYLTWTVTGPQDDLLLGVDGAVIDVPFPVNDGSVLRIDTDPTGVGATLDGVDCTTALGFQVFGRVPAKGTSPLSITSTGNGQVTASLTPLFWRAF